MDAAHWNAVEFSGFSDVGLRRSNNQDSWAVHLAPDAPTWSQRGHVFIVADGMGAHAVGELASKMAIDMILLNYQKHSDGSGAEALRQAFEEANGGIHTRGLQNREFEGMGTTVTALVLLPAGALVAHVGDSRAYRVRHGLVEQLSFDHSLSWELQRRGQVKVGEHFPRNVIVRSLGPAPKVEVDLEGPFDVEPGDRYVLCSDGLSNQVSDAEIGALAAWLAPEQACLALVDLANLRGGPDNITVVIVRVPDSRTETPRPRNWTQTIRSIFHRRAKEPGALGEGPYRHAEVQVNEELVVALATSEAQLRRTAIDEAWKVDWSSFFARHNEAEEHTRQLHWESAYQSYVLAVSVLMAGMRKQRKASRRDRSSGSGIQPQPTGR